MVGFNWPSNSTPSREIFASFLNFIGQSGMLIWLYAIIEKSVEILKRKDVDFQTMKSYKYAVILTLISISLLFILKNIEPQTLATQGEIKSGGFYTYKRIFYLTELTLATGAFFVYRNTVKLLASAETGEERSFSEYYKTFLLLIILPWIAVWFVQPRVKKL